MRKRYSVDEPRRSYRGLRFCLVLLLAVGIFGHITWTKHVSAEHLAEQKAAAQALQEAKQKRDNFNSQVTALLATDPGDTFSVVTASNLLPLQTLGSTDVFDGASTGKLLTAADLLTHVEQGTISLQQNIDGETAQTWLQRMIVNSDNDAWEELNDYLTHPSLSSYAASINFTNYDPDNNTFTSTDVADLLQKLYTGKLLAPTERDLLLSYLKQANYRQYIVAAVPDGYTVYHKIGFDDDELNDTAIITKGDKYLILAFYSNGNGRYDQDVRTGMIHTITTDAIAAYL